MHDTLPIPAVEFDMDCEASRSAICRCHVNDPIVHRYGEYSIFITAAVFNTSSIFDACCRCVRYCCTMGISIHWRRFATPCCHTGLVRIDRWLSHYYCLCSSAFYLLSLISPYIRPWALILFSNSFPYGLLMLHDCRRLWTADRESLELPISSHCSPEDGPMSQVNSDLSLRDYCLYMKLGAVGGRDVRGMVVIFIPSHPSLIQPDLDALKMTVSYLASLMT